MMPEIFQQLPISISQGTLNSFASTSIATGLVPAGGFGIEIVALEINPATGASLGTGSMSLIVEMTKNEETDLLGLDDSDVIALFGYQALYAASPSGAQFPVPLQLKLMTPVIVVGPNIHLGMRTSGFSGATSLKGRALYRTVKMSEVDILRILQA